MTNFYKSSLFGIALLAAGTLTANAADYISVSPNITPANGYVGGPTLQIMITWPGVTLEMADTNKDANNYLDPSVVSVSVNGNAINLGTSTMEGNVIVKNVQNSNEQSGGGTSDVYSALYINFPDMAFWWNGTVNVELKEGAVTSTTGEINQAISLSYTFKTVNSNVTWTPAANNDNTNVTFEQGECVIYASWEGYDNISLNTGISSPSFYQKEDASNDDKYGSQISVANYMSVENGKVKFDFTSFEPGIYMVCLTTGSVDLGNGEINGEATYNFQILEGVTPPPYYVSILPDESYGWFDGFSIKWGDAANKPYALSSDYAEYNSDNGKYIFTAAGVNMINVKENGTDNIEVLSVAFEEYQETENSANVSNAQLIITLADMQFNVDSRYSVTIPAGMIKIDTPNGVAYNTAVTYTFTLKAGAQFTLPEPTVTPKEGTLSNLETVKLSWASSVSGLDGLNLNELSGESVSATINGNPYAGVSAEIEWADINNTTDGWQGDVLVISFDKEMVEKGTYVITVPADYMMVTDVDGGSQMNKEVTITYTVDGTSGVESITVEGLNTVYNLNGVKVMDASNGDLNNLQKGIYIVNGKKVIIK